MGSLTLLSSIMQEKCISSSQARTVDQCAILGILEFELGLFCMEVLCL